MLPDDKAGNFTDVLHQAQVDTAIPDERAFAAHARRAVMDVIGAVVAPTHARPVVGSEDAAARIAQLYGTEPMANAENPRPVSIATIEEELALHPAMSPDDLRAVRRDYALRNHPDRVPERLRTLSTLKMTLANTIIDAAIERRIKMRG